MTDKEQLPKGGQQVTVAGLMGYAALWAVVICLFRQAAQLQQGTYTIAESRLSDILMLLSGGLLCVAIGLPITILVGKSRQAAPVALGCFLTGVLAIPLLVVILVILASAGIVDLD